MPEVSGIFPSEVGRNDRCIVPSASGLNQQVSWALAATGSRKEGYTVPELRIRLLAADAPFWPAVVMQGDFSWLARQPERPPTARGRVGVCHAFDHKEPKGSKTACDTVHGSGSERCTVTAPSMGDGERRYLYVGYDRPAFDSSVQATVKAAQERFTQVVLALREAGFKDERIKATPSIALYLENGMQMPAGKAKAPARKRRAKTSSE